MSHAAGLRYHELTHESRTLPSGVRLSDTPASPALRRELGLRDLVLFNIAAVVGIRWLAAAAHTGPGSITLWVLAAALFFVPSALAVAALSRRFPEEGGIYVWTRRGFGDWHGFLCGWCYWLSNVFYFPSLLLAGVGMAATALGFAENSIWLVILRLAILWIASVTNIVGLAVGKWTGNLGGFATYMGGALIIVLGLLVWLRFGSATVDADCPGVEPGQAELLVADRFRVRRAGTGSHHGRRDPESGEERAARGVDCRAGHCGVLYCGDAGNAGAAAARPHQHCDGTGASRRLPRARAWESAGCRWCWHSRSVSA